MDSAASEGFAQIAAIAKLALNAFERPETYHHLENIVSALRLIGEQAHASTNAVNCLADDVGAGYVNQAQLRRAAAQREAKRTN